MFCGVCGELTDSTLLCPTCMMNLNLSALVFLSNHIDYEPLYRIAKEDTQEIPIVVRSDNEDGDQVEIAVQSG